MQVKHNDSVIMLAILMLIMIAGSSLIRKRDSADKVQNNQSPLVIQDSSSTSPVVAIDSTHADLVLYYPPVDSIDLRCLTPPTPDIDTNVVFCCAAAYTDSNPKVPISHIKIAGHHVYSGKKERGYRNIRNTGAFFFYKGKWKFLYDKYAHELDSAAINNGCGYAQEMLIHEGSIRKTARPNTSFHKFRALCEKDGQLCIIESRDSVYFGIFKNQLLDVGVKEALYTDMGDYGYSWYREYPGDKATYILQEIQPMATNWLVFYYTE